MRAGGWRRDQVLVEQGQGEEELDSTQEEEPDLKE
jgi:hypothetical protein